MIFVAGVTKSPLGNRGGNKVRARRKGVYSRLEYNLCVIDVSGGGHSKQHVYFFFGALAQRTCFSTSS